MNRNTKMKLRFLGVMSLISICIVLFFAVIGAVLGLAVATFRMVAR